MSVIDGTGFLKVEFLNPKYYEKGNDYYTTTEKKKKDVKNFCFCNKKLNKMS